jgi:hypothetical protein
VFLDGYTGQVLVSVRSCFAKRTSTDDGFSHLDGTVKDARFMARFAVGLEPTQVCR